MENKIRQILTEMLDFDGDISDNFSPEDSPNWDSMNNLRIITALEETFKIQFTMDEIMSMTDLGKIMKTVAKHYES